MSFIHSCFISYKYSDDELTRKFIFELAEALDIATGQYLDGQKSYYDVARLKPGYKFNESLSKALAASTCMIAVLSPRYFRSDYCYREYLGMQVIENQRRTTTGSPPIGKSLIIPLLFRGKPDDIPKELKEHIHYMALPYIMSNLGLALKHDPNLIPIIEVLGQLIYEHYQAYDIDSARLAVECGADFEFPACPAAGPWPNHKPKPQAFVGRVV
jgi:TIR domain